MHEIDSITSYIIFDSRGQQTLEITLKLANGVAATASVPQGKSRGSGEAVYLPPSDAVTNIDSLIAPALHGMSCLDQKAIDEKLNSLDGTPTKEKLGANAILAVSIATARAAALSQKIPLWSHLRKIFGPVPKSAPVFSRPRLFVNLINGGAHAQNNLAFQEYLAIIDGPNFQAMLDTETVIQKNLQKILEELAASQTADGSAATISTGDEGGFAPNLADSLEPFRLIRQAAGNLLNTGEVCLGTDVAGANSKLSSAELTSLFEKAINDFKLIYIEDPYEEKDFASFAALTATYGDRLAIVGDDLTVTNSALMRIAHENKSINGVIIKPNQIGTVSEALDAVRTAQGFGWQVVASHRSGETEDTFIADFAFAVGAFGLKLGVPTQPVRLAKYNRLLEIDLES